MDLPLSLVRRGARLGLSLPEPTLRRVLGPAPRNDRGQALDLHTQVLLGVAARLRPLAPGEKGVGLMRHDFELQTPLPDFPAAPMHRVEDRWIPGPGGRLRVRIYQPGPRGARPRAICVYAHGGGFVLGSLDSHDGICRHLAARTDCIVVALDYRLAPEHKFPAPVLDGVAAFRWTVEHATELGGDPHRVGLAGDSAGGNIAAVVAWHEREAAVPPRFQLLVYPACDFTHDTDSFRRLGKGYLLESDTILWFRKQYLVEYPRDARDPMGSIVVAPDVSRCAPAYVVVAGFDPLRDEGERYAKKLAEAGVRTELVCEDGLVHGFFSMGGVIPAARRAVDRALDALRAGVA